MAKKLTAKQKQKRLQKARKDGKVTRKEAKDLRALGISSKKITNTKQGSVKVTKQATKNASKPAPKPTPTPKPTPKPTPAPSPRPTPPKAKPSPTPTRNPTPSPSPSYSNVKEDTGNRFLSGQQAKVLTNRLKNPARLPGITETRQDPDTGEDVTTTTPGKIDYAALANDRLVGKALRGLKNQDGKVINNFNSENDIAKVLAYAKPLSSQGDISTSKFGKRGSGDIRDIRDQLGIDRGNALDLAESFRRKDIKITDPKYQNLINKIRTGINSGEGEFAIPQLNRTFTGLGEGDLSIVGTGAYQRQLNGRKDQKQDYKAAESDLTASLDQTTDDLTKDTRDETTGLKGDLTDSTNKLTEDIENIPYGDVDVQKLLDELGLKELIGEAGERPDVRGDLKEDTSDYQEGTDTRDSDYKDLINSLTLQTNELGSLNDNFAANNTFLKAELQTAKSQAEAAEERAKNLRNAYVPTANPNAMSILAGDFRRSRRRKEDNQLSDLAVLTDLGNNKSSLSGLQLA